MATETTRGLLSIGLGIVIPPQCSVPIFAGALFMVDAPPLLAKPKSMGRELRGGSHEPFCAGLIAGAALIGLTDILVQVFVLK